MSRRISWKKIQTSGTPEYIFEWEAGDELQVHMEVCNDSKGSGSENFAIQFLSFSGKRPV